MGNQSNTISHKIQEILSLIPGVAFLFIVGLVAKYIGAQIPHISFLIIAIAIGIIISNTIGLPPFIEKGIETHKLWLQIGIVVLGSQVIIADLLGVGSFLLLMILGYLVFGLLFTEFISSRFGLESRLGSSLASGVSICGVSAIIATSEGIKTRSKDIAYAIATILAFDVVTVFLYPTIGNLFSIPGEVFGPWTGISMLSTGTVVAAGFAHSEVAGQLATIVKMARNSFIGLVALLYTLYYVRKGASTYVHNKAKYLWDKFPKFVIGFLFIMIVANLGLLDKGQMTSMKNAYSWLFMLAFVGMGYDIDVKEIKKTGFKPLLVVFIVFIIISISSLVLSYLFFA